jgi:hypothetical protein
MKEIKSKLPKVVPHYSSTPMPLSGLVHDRRA